MITNIASQKSDATTTIYAQTDHTAVSSAQLPSGFLPESDEPDPDDIETVRIPLMIAGEEPDDELLARAEALPPCDIGGLDAGDVGQQAIGGLRLLGAGHDVSQQPGTSQSLSETHLLALPNLFTRLKEIHRRTSLLPWWIIEPCHALAGRILS